MPYLIVKYADKSGKSTGATVMAFVMCCYTLKKEVFGHNNTLKNDFKLSLIYQFV